MERSCSEVLPECGHFRLVADDVTIEEGSTPTDKNKRA